MNLVVVNTILETKKYHIQKAKGFRFTFWASFQLGIWGLLTVNKALACDVPRYDEERPLYSTHIDLGEILVL
jgi:hypothetical protein